MDCNPAGTAASQRFAKRVKIPLSACSENMHCAEQLAALPAAAHLHSKTAFLHEKRLFTEAKAGTKAVCLAQIGKGPETRLWSACLAQHHGMAGTAFAYQAVV